MRIVAAALLLTSCTLARHTEKQEEVKARVEQLGEVRRWTEEKVDQGTVKIKTTVEEFAPGGGADVATAESPAAPRPPSGGALVRRTVTEETRDPAVRVTRTGESSTSTAIVNLDASTQEKAGTEVRAGPPWWVWSLLCIVLMALGSSSAGCCREVRCLREGAKGERPGE